MVLKTVETKTAIKQMLCDSFHLYVKQYLRKFFRKNYNYKLPEILECMMYVIVEQALDRYDELLKEKNIKE